MKTAYGCFEKGHGAHEKKNISKTKLKPMYQTKKIGGTHKFCFTDIKTVLQKCEPNERLHFLFYTLFYQFFFFFIIVNISSFFLV